MGASARARILRRAGGRRLQEEEEESSELARRLEEVIEEVKEGNEVSSESKRVYEFSGFDEAVDRSLRFMLVSGSSLVRKGSSPPVSARAKVRSFEVDPLSWNISQSAQKTPIAMRLNRKRNTPLCIF